MMIDLARLDDEQHPLFLKLREQEQYLMGVLWADQDLRLNPAVDASAIDPFGTGTKAFWRGLLETAGSIRMDSAGGRDYSHPHVSLKAAYTILVKFLAFLQEEICTRNHIQWQWDDDGKLDWQTKGGFIRVTGQKAQDIIRVLYLGESVGRESARNTADRIVAWSSGKRR